MILWLGLATAYAVGAVPSLQAQTCTTPGPRFVVTGGAYYVVRMDGDSISAHTSVWAAAGVASQLWNRHPGAALWIDPPGGRIRVEGCRVGPAIPDTVFIHDTVFVSPPPPPPPPAPWSLELVDREVLADTLRAVVTLRLVRGDGSPVAGSVVIFRAEGGGGFGNNGATLASRTSNAQGHVAIGWVSVGDGDVIRASADSAPDFSVHYQGPAPPAPAVALAFAYNADSTSVNLSATWPLLGGDSVYVAAFGGIPTEEPRVMFLPPGARSWSGSFAVNRAERDVWDMLVCVALLPDARLGNVICGQVSLPVPSS